MPGKEMGNLKTNLVSFVNTTATLPKVGWRLSARYNPQVVSVLKANGLSHDQAVKIAANPQVRTFSGKLTDRWQLFNLGVGSTAAAELRKAGLLVELPINVPVRSWGFELPENSPALAALTADGNNPALLSHRPEIFFSVSQGTGAGAPERPDVNLFKIQENLKTARSLFATNRPQEAQPVIDQLMTDIKDILAQGVSPDDPVVSYFYAVQLMKKFINVPNNADTPKAGGRQVGQVLILDSKRQQVLLQKRGPFKRMYPDTFCVSANFKPKKPEDFLSAAVKAVKDEVGIDVDSSRLEQIGERNQYGNHLTSHNFYAFSPEEEQALSHTAQSLREELGNASDITVQYNPNTRALMVFTTNVNAERARLDRILEQIQARTGIPPIFSFSDTDTNSLLVYQLNEAEEAQVNSLIAGKKQTRETAAAEMRNAATERTLKNLDSDEMLFVPWVRVRCDSITNPEEFTTVLTGPYFPNDAVWSAMGFRLPRVLNIDDPVAGLTCVSGGKGANMHILRNLFRDDPENEVPETDELTTFVFEEYVLGNPEIRADIELLDRTRDPQESRVIAGRIRNRIMALELDEDLKRQIEASFRRLGYDIAERSSATAEDLKKYQAAGQAETSLHQIDLEAAFNSVKKVWASLFSDGFVAYRNSIGFPHINARMAVLLQTFSDAKAAGVINSFDQATERPGYRISAQPGIGEGVVEGEGLADSWLVGILCADERDILQRNIPVKTTRVVARSDGGTERQSINMSAPSLDDVTVLKLARAAKKIHTHYKENGLADDVDVEYVVSKGGKNVIVQTRAKRSQRITTEGRTVIKVKTVDESKLPPGTAIIELDPRSETAVQGAVVSILQLDPHREPKKVLPGRILATHHTNNEYNAAFGSLDGVITTDGDQTSHAAQHAYEKKIPCVVGSLGALDILKLYDGREVTFDAGKKKIYLGRVPIVDEERVLDVWLTDEREIAGFVDEGSRHENLRPWEYSKKKRPLVFVEDPEFHCRRRSHTYGYFQLDYFYRAWDRQAEILNKMFAGRAPWTLTPQGRQIKAIENKHQLVHIVEDNDPHSVYNFLMGVPGFSIDDMEALFEARLNGFKRFAEFTHSLQRIDRSNVASLVDELLNIFSWMHFGFWLDSVVEEFAFDQLRYISNAASFHNVLREEAAADLPRDYRVDPLNPSIPAGRILNLSREKEKEVYALLETIRSTPELRLVFENDDPVLIRRALEASYPQALATIERWSMRYKLTLEDLDVLSDADEYLADLRKRIQTNSTMSLEMISNIYQAYLKVHGPENGNLEAIRLRDPNLYLLIRSRGRSLASSEIESEITSRLPQVLGQLDTIDRSDATVREAARQVLAQYPEIKKVLAVSKQQFPLREDAHHLIVPFQREIGRMMIESAQPFVGTVFAKPEDVFNIGMEEYVSLLQESDPGYVALTLKRWPLLLQAEIKLKNSWTVKKTDLAALTPDVEELWANLTYENRGQGYLDNRGFIQDKGRALQDSSQMQLAPKFEPFREQIFAVLRRPVDNLPAEISAFEASTNEAIQILEQQIQAATLPRVKKYYRVEQARLRQRVEDFKTKLEKEIN